MNYTIGLSRKDAPFLFVCFFGGGCTFSLPFDWIRIEPTRGWLENTQGESYVANLSQLSKTYELHIVKFRLCGNRRWFHFLMTKILTIRKQY